MMQKKTIQPQITHDHEGHAHVNCPGLAPCRLCRIEVDHLSVSAGHQQLLHDVNLHIHCGELTALIGANGAGKTTLIRALLGQVEYKAPRRAFRRRIAACAAGAGADPAARSADSG